MRSDPMHRERTRPPNDAIRSRRRATGPVRSSMAPILALATLIAAFVLAACGGGGPGTGVPGTGPVTVLIGPEGGEIEARGDDGARLRLVLPEGATAEAIELTLVPLEAGASVAGFELRPFGVRLRLPVTFELTLPDAAPAGTLLVLGSGEGRVPLPVELGADGRRLRAATPQLGYPGAAAGASAPAIAASDQAPSGVVAAEILACLDALAALRFARQPQEEGWQLTLAQANAIRDAAGAVAAACLAPGEVDDARLERAAMGLASCVHLAAVASIAIDGFRPDVGTPLDDLWPYVVAIVAHAATVQFAGAECDPAVPWLDVIDTLFARFVAGYEARVASIDADLWRLTWLTEFRTLDALMQAAALFGLPDASVARTRGLVGTLIDRLRPAAWAVCLEDRTQAYLADLLNGGGAAAPVVWPGSFPEDLHGLASADDLRADIQACGTRVTLEVFDALAERLDERTVVVGRGDAPGAAVTEATLGLPEDGALVLSGELRALRCERANVAVPPAFDLEELLVRFAGAEVARRTPGAGNHLAAPLDLSRDELLAAAGLPANASGTHLLELVRDGTGCGQTYGDPVVTIARIAVDLGEPAFAGATITNVRCDVTASLDDLEDVYRFAGDDRILAAPGRIDPSASVSEGSVESDARMDCTWLATPNAVQANGTASFTLSDPSLMARMTVSLDADVAASVGRDGPDGWSGDAARWDLTWGASTDMRLTLLRLEPTNEVVFSADLGDAGSQTVTLTPGRYTLHVSGFAVTGSSVPATPSDGCPLCGGAGTRLTLGLTATFAGEE